MTEAPPIGIVEIDAGGHRLEYVRNIVEIAADEGRRSIVYTTKPVTTTEQFAIRLADLVDSGICSVEANGNTCHTTLDKRRFWKWVLAETRQQEVALAIPNIDEQLIPLLSQPFTPRIAGIVMRPPTMTTKSLPKHVALQAAKIRGFSLRELRSPWEQTVDNSILDPSGLNARDIVPDEILLTKIQTWLNHSKVPVALVAGAIDGRKHVREILQALTSTEDANDFRLIITGAHVDKELSTEIQTVATNHPNKLFVINRFVTDEELRAALQSSDVTLLLYANAVGSSGILSWTLSSRTPVVAYGNATIVRVVEQNSTFGIVATSTKTTAIRNAITAAVKCKVDEENIPDWKTSWLDWLKPILIVKS